ncbi:hypothetical protein [Listeria grayi]|uniref:hypothetical protein n=1 Tax=Listeria grayi TaxID=1641 RepID=UPI0021139E7D|nr:hypothetical protein [Listeria grayi]
MTHEEKSIPQFTRFCDVSVGFIFDLLALVIIGLITLKEPLMVKGYYFMGRSV